MPETTVVTPLTADYLWLGMVIIAIIMGVLIASYFVRARSLQRDMEMLDSLEKE